MARTHILAAVAASLIALASTAAAECVDINADPVDRLTAIAHIDGERAGQLIAGRPWPSVRSLTGIQGVGRGRIRDILVQDLACVGVRAPRGQREIIEGVATVLDGDTFDVAGERVRLIGKIISCIIDVVGLDARSRLACERQSPPRRSASMQFLEFGSQPNSYNGSSYGTAMQRMSARDAKNGFGRSIDLARAEPVAIEKHGGAVVVVIAFEEYECLTGNEGKENGPTKGESRPPKGKQ